jgi:rRNA maturation endonuclease Nob1
MNDIVRHCPHCQKCYFIIETLDGEKDVCPFCGKKEEEFNPFKEMFGNDNPFSGFGVT